MLLFLKYLHLYNSTESFGSEIYEVIMNTSIYGNTFDSISWFTTSLTKQLGRLVKRLREKIRNFLKTEED